MNRNVINLQETAPCLTFYDYMHTSTQISYIYKHDHTGVVNICKLWEIENNVM